ncbi:unnamed protein product [Nesidiocoris tenuis]|uniref:Uncharacterized protein n=1 Tax=Nesidiocoris tenuis TaxID=355587 RepID=A0A6H5H554_9HEMI|nr:unnamed protein product [Nesidiocoris tenuis]
MLTGDQLCTNRNQVVKRNLSKKRIRVNSEDPLNNRLKFWQNKDVKTKNAQIGSFLWPEKIK